MESEVYYKRVGIFLTIGIIVSVAIIIWLFGVNTFKTGDRYIIYFENQTLDGLQKDSLVTMKGIRVGVVDNYNISPNNIQRVKVLITLDEGTPIKLDTRAVIKRNLLTGIAKIDLIGGTQNSSELTYQNDSTGEYPVIPEEVPELDRIADGLPDLLGKFDNIVARLLVILSEENVNSINDTLFALNNFSTQISEATPLALKTIKNSEEITSNVLKIVKSMSGTEEEAGAVENINKATEELKNFSKELKVISRELSPLILNISRSTQTITREISNMSDSINIITETYQDPNLLLKGDNENSK